jgi:hypothetical protein
MCSQTALAQVTFIWFVPQEEGEKGRGGGRDRKYRKLLNQLTQYQLPAVQKPGPLKSLCNSCCPSSLFSCCTRSTPASTQVLAQKLLPCPIPKLSDTHSRPCHTCPSCYEHTSPPLVTACFQVYFPIRLKAQA